MDIAYCTINLYAVLKSKYSEYLKPEIISIELIQSEDGVWVEATEAETVLDGLDKKTIKRVNLDFVVQGDGEEALFFNPADPIEHNAAKFIDEFSAHSIANTLELFHDEACLKFGKKDNPFSLGI